MKFLSKKNNIIGLVMIIIGGVFVIDKYFGIKINISWSEIWPFLLILWGVVVMMKK